MDKEANREYHRKYRAENIDKIRESQRKYRIKNRVKVNAYACKYASEHREKMDFFSKRHRDNQRKDVISHYGGRCDCCGENRIEFLAIDHIKGNGRKHREKVGPMICRWLIANNYPEGFRILCHNCNSAIGFYGYCPHEVLI
uniref:Uncharacterized protein n=1 Tax=viral metagenome TaxID=1070528 RepID=A0A6M3IJ65_9ZZZZ